MPSNERFPPFVRHEVGVPGPTTSRDGTTVLFTGISRYASIQPQWAVCHSTWNGYGHAVFSPSCFCSSFCSYAGMFVKYLISARTWHSIFVKPAFSCSYIHLGGLKLTPL